MTVCFNLPGMLISHSSLLSFPLLRSSFLSLLSFPALLLSAPPSLPKSPHFSPVLHSSPCCYRYGLMSSEELHLAGSLPNGHASSDHLPLIAEFAFQWPPQIGSQLFVWYLWTVISWLIFEIRFEAAGTLSAQITWVANTDTDVLNLPAIDCRQASDFLHD